MASQHGSGTHVERRVLITVTGIVQGVGFRPFVYRAATSRGLGGYARNTLAGVEIDIEGSQDAVGSFCSELEVNPPSNSRIDSITSVEFPLNHPRSFEIIESGTGASRSALVSPDLALCDDCRREMLDPRDRRFHYPFINCTHCGPRYTIVDDIPYDRRRTSMREFPMCPECYREYHDPLDRRFHAQPVACFTCGPRLALVGADGHLMLSGAGDAYGARDRAEEILSGAAERLRLGKVVALRGLGGFHLAANARCDDALELLRTRKHRPGKPFAVMARSIDDVRSFANVNPEEEVRLASAAHPILLLAKKNPFPLSTLVAPDNPFVGVMLPYTPLHVLLFEISDLPPLIMTSGNLSEEAIAIGNEEAIERLHGIADAFVLHDRDIRVRCDDSVLRVVNGEPSGRSFQIMVRRARGFAPLPVQLPSESPDMIAAGAELKNTICVVKGRRAFLSQHVGDLDHTESIDAFEETVDHLTAMYGIRPELVVHDLHPDYYSTHWALRFAGAKGIGTVGVQHHHAHIASCMAENGVTEPVVGIALDGTGFGTDGTVWGGEVLLTDGARFERVGRLGHLALPGGDLAATEIWRMALSALIASNGADAAQCAAELLPRSVVDRLPFVQEAVEKKINTPQTSSCGRLFDAVASLIGLRQEVTYEGEAAMMLEAAAERGTRDDAPYGFSVCREGMGRTTDSKTLPICPFPAEGEGTPAAEPLTANELFNISPVPVIRSIVADLRGGVPKETIARRFHNGLVTAFATVAGCCARQAGIRTIALSGGSFQNALLLRGLTTALEAEGFHVIAHRDVPANDGGIALGQVFAALRRIQSVSV